MTSAVEFMIPLTKPTVLQYSKADNKGSVDFSNIENSLFIVVIFMKYVPRALPE